MTYLCVILADSGHAAIAGRAAGQVRGEASPTELFARRAGPGDSAVTLHVRDGELTILEGAQPWDPASSPEYVVLEARDLNDAIRLALRLVPSSAGRLELRPILSSATE